MVSCFDKNVSCRPADWIRSCDLCRSTLITGVERRTMKRLLPTRADCTLFITSLGGLLLEKYCSDLRARRAGAASLRRGCRRHHYCWRPGCIPATTAPYEGIQASREASARGFVGPSDLDRR